MPEISLTSEKELYVISKNRSDIFVEGLKIEEKKIDRFTNIAILNSHNFSILDTLKFIAYWQPSKKTAFQQIVVKSIDEDKNLIDSVQLIADKDGVLKGQFEN